MRVVVAVLATVLVVGATSVEAARLITGKQIARNTITGKNVKNGSLQVAYLSPRARAALRGARGPAGPQGLPGTNGATGPQGPKGTTDIVYADSAPVSVPPGQIGSAFAACPANSVATGGAFGPATESQFFVTTDVVVAMPNDGIGDAGYFVIAKNNDAAAARNIQARAACARR
jgi:hypothetical protein